jgi:hypothetical protein
MMPARQSTSPAPWLAGISRRIITPAHKTELAGLGYYLGRTARHVRDHLTASALVITDRSGNSAAILALDIMYGSTELTQMIRQGIAAKTGIAPQAICVNCSHSHNAPTAGFARGVGEVDQDYVTFVASQAIDAAAQAWRERQSARLSTGWARADGVAFNRTRENGPVDSLLGLLRIDTPLGKPFALAVNYHCHLNAHLDLDLHAVSRDWPGEVIDALEQKLPGTTVLYLQGSCGDVMVAPQFCSTERSFEVARVITSAALAALDNATPIIGEDLQAETSMAVLPTRRWTREEIAAFNDEGRHRLRTGDLNGWLEGFARHIVTYPDRLPLRYGGSTEKAVAAISRFAVEWSESALVDLEKRPEFLQTEVQAMRIGDVFFAAHSSELFTSLGLAVRRDWPNNKLFMLGYSNGSLGYLPDAYDVKRRSYAADQSPKFTGQFPFTPESGEAMVKALLGILKATHPGH